MKKRTVFRVMALGDDWEVREDGKSIAIFSRVAGQRKKQAVIWARDRAKRTQPSQVVIHGRDGKIQREYTYPRSSDPKRFKG